MHPHTIRMALVHGLIEGARKNKDNRWEIPQKWVTAYSPSAGSELLCDFLTRTGISRTSAIHASKMGKIKLTTIHMPWTDERGRVYINANDPATQIWMAECRERKAKEHNKNLQTQQTAEKAEAAPQIEETPNVQKTAENEKPIDKKELLARYDALLKRWQQLNDEAKKSFIGYWGIPFTYHSCKMEDERVRGVDVTDVWDAKKSAKSAKSVLITKIIGACLAYKLFETSLKNNLSLNLDLIKKIHLLLTDGTYDENLLAQGERPGHFKSSFSILDPDDAGAAPEDVETELAELLDEIKDIDNKNALTAAAYFLANFESIHPFSDGTGRAARLLMNYILVQHEHPPIIIREDNRKTYLDALKAWSERGDIEPMKQLLRDQGIRSWVRLDADAVRSMRAKTRKTRLKDLLKKSS